MTSSAHVAAGGSAHVRIPVPYAPHCPGATGVLAGTHLGPVRLGMTRAQARRALRNSSARRTAHSEYFCLTPAGIQVGYRVGRVVWISTGSASYSELGTAVGARFAGAGLRPLALGGSSWYLRYNGPATAVIETRGGVVQTIAIATHRLTRSRTANHALVAAFG